MGSIQTTSAPPSPRGTRTRGFGGISVVPEDEDGSMNPGGGRNLVPERQALHRERHVLFCERQAFLCERHVHEMKDVLDSTGWNLCIATHNPFDK
ncbi:Hypothetical protein FKW44_003139 [Caligus rogercresseyi]|uniref:Uncharacterized protein n=1 Tax=Caligus rogercresseyi TaxID=217165 RepID=A0A7T8KL82_CALRO|nr:Hypothetical protein FKW44_003139 [Caligus rogercresseyi]